MSEKIQMSFEVALERRKSSTSERICGMGGVRRKQRGERRDAARAESSSSLYISHNLFNSTKTPAANQILFFPFIPADLARLLFTSSYMSFIAFFCDPCYVFLHLSPLSSVSLSVHLILHFLCHTSPSSPCVLLCYAPGGK